MPIVKNYLDKLISVQNVKIERLFEELNGPNNEIELFYFELSSTVDRGNCIGMSYNSVTGRIEEIKVKFGRIP